MAGTIGVTQLSDYNKDYQDHAESRAADSQGHPSGRDTVGLLGRLRVRSTHVKRIGEGVDRLSGDDGATLDEERPIEYVGDDIANEVAFLKQFPQAEIASALQISERAWRNIVSGVSRPRSGRRPDPATGVKCS